MNAALAVQNILSNDSGYNALVGGNAALARIAYVEMDQTTQTPCAIVYGDGVKPNDTNSGVSTLDFDLVWVTHFASTFNVVAQMATAARTALDRVTGTYNGVTVVSIQFRDERDSSELLVDGKKVTKEQLYQVMTTH